MQEKSYVDILKGEFERRKLLNPSYSLRAFARDLSMSPPRLSQILSGKHGLSVKAAGEISKKLKLDDESHQWFCDSVGALHARGGKERREFQAKIKKIKEKTKKFTKLQLEYFEVISDWYNFAILELTLECSQLGSLAFVTLCRHPSHQPLAEF